MSPRVQKQTIAFIEKSLPHIKQLHIAWYGGEPLLQMPTIERIADAAMMLCKKYNCNYSSMMVSNGYLLTTQTARKLEKYGVQQIQITFDGPPEIHDKIRKLRTGGARTFEHIAGNVKKAAQRTKMSFSLRINVDARNKDDMFQLIDELERAGLSGQKNIQLYFAPIEAITESCHCVADTSMQKSEYAKVEYLLYRYAYKKGLTNLPYPPRFKGACAATKVKGFVINPNGDIHKCWDTVTVQDRKVGDIFHPDAILNNEIYDQWLAWNPFDNDICRRCKLVANCAGACAYKFIYSDDTKGEAAVLPCLSWRYNLNERLVLRAEKMAAYTDQQIKP